MPISISRLLRSCSSFAAGIKRSAIYVGLPAVVLAGPAAGAQLDVAGLHEKGVRFVLERLDSVPPRRSANARIGGLLQEYCKSVVIKCPPVIIPTFPLNRERLIAAAPGSRALKDTYRSLFRAVAAAKTIGDLDAALGSIEKQAADNLTIADNARFLAVLSIARSTGRLWAPSTLGGEGGGGIKLPPPRTATQAKEIDWKEVAAADALGCLATIEVGCVAGAIAFSVADIVEQLLS